MPKQFKGGNATVNSGSIGPDIYLFRALPSGRWAAVSLRTKQGRDIYEADKQALTVILKSLERVDYYDGKKRYTTMGRPAPIGAAEFLQQVKI